MRRTRGRSSALAVACGLLAACGTSAGSSTVAPPPSTAATAGQTDSPAGSSPTSIETPDGSSPTSIETPAGSSPTSAPVASAGAAAGPDTTAGVPTVPPTAGVPAAGCTGPGRTAVIDRARQRAWLCDGALRSGPEFPVTTAISQPDPGTYQVIERDEVTVSSLEGQVAYLERFVVFTHGKFRGARIGFHALPRTADGTLLQDPDTVGDLDRRGESAGCIRALPEDAARIWEWLGVGATVTVLS